MKSFNNSSWKCYLKLVYNSNNIVAKIMLYNIVSISHVKSKIVKLGFCKALWHFAK